MQQGIHDTGPETPSAGTRRLVGSTPVCQQRLSPFASVADQPIDTSSSPPPAPGIAAAASANQQPQTPAYGAAGLSAAAGQAATPEPIGAAALPSSQHISLLAAAFASHVRPQHAEPPAAAAMLSPAAAAAGQLLRKGLMTPEDTATAAAAVAAAINAASNHSPMASPLPQQHMQQQNAPQQEEEQEELQEHQQPGQQQRQQQQRKQASSVSLQEALLSVMLREVLPDEVNNLKDTLEVLTHFDLQVRVCVRLCMAWQLTGWAIMSQAGHQGLPQCGQLCKDEFSAAWYRSHWVLAATALPDAYDWLRHNNWSSQSGLVNPSCYSTAGAPEAVEPEAVGAVGPDLVNSNQLLCTSSGEAP